MATTGIAQQVSAFQAYTTKDGLPSNYVMSIDEDENGFLWIGTDKGLAKFDGFTWQVFTTDNGLPGNYIIKVICTGKGSIWLGVSSKGLCHYNIGTGKVTLVKTGVAPYEHQTNSNGDLFFYSFEGKYNKTGYTVKNETPAKAQKIFTYNDSLANFTLAVDFRRQHLELIKNNTDNKSNNPFSLQNHLNWKIDTAGFTIDYYDLLRKLNDSVYTNPNSIFLTKSKNGSIPVRIFGPHNEYLHILESKNGYYIWDEKTGLYNINKDGKTENHYTEKDGLTNSMVTDVKQIKNNQLLLSTLGGGLFMKLPKRNARISTERAIKSLAQKDKTIYAVSEGKLLLIDLNNLTTVQEFKLPEKSVQGINVFGNDIYISTLSGYSVYNIVGNQLQKNESQYIGAGVSSVIKFGDKYYAGSYGSHIWEQAGKNQNRYEGSALTMAVSEKLLPLSNCFAALNYEDGVQFIYPNHKYILVTTKNGLPANAVYDVHEYKDTLWISTARGIAAYTNGKVVKTFTAVNGIKGNLCLFSFHDNKGNYWVVTDKYLNEYKNNQFIALSSAPIIEGKDDMVQSYTYNIETNTLVTGSLKRIFITQLNSFERELNNTVPSLQAASYDNKEITVLQSFTLPVTFTDISFTFKPAGANPFIKPEIYYKLQGSKDNYILINDSLTIHFSKLRSGNYKLYAKYINADGVESEEKLLAKFSVDAPYWQKGWFNGLSIAVAALGLFGISYLLRKRKQKKLADARLLQETLTKERERISKDLHDHLGTSLVTMIAQTDNIENKLMHNNIPDALQKVQQLSEQSRETVNVLRETIWAVQENSHSLEEFILRTRSFLQRVLPQKNIEWDVTITGELQNKLTANQSLQLFRIIQEATQNIVKHSAATKAGYIFTASENLLQVNISDNGKGFDKNKPITSNGLKNISQRINDLSGTWKIESDKGTSIMLSVPLNKTTASS
ncbi:sensor histidine kinase [Ferruginibacter sp.]|nr:hypothetical protein [Ferruginibacter sp.]